MRSGSFALLACLTAAAVIAAAAAPRPERGFGLSKNSGELVYPDLAPALADVSEIRLKTPETMLTFTRDGDIWRAAERGGYPADARKLTETVLALSRLTYVEPKTARPELYPRLQIEDSDAEGAASRRIRLAGRDGAVLADLTAGRRQLDTAAAARRLYIRKTGEPQGWLAAGALNIANDSESWLRPEIVHIPPVRVKNAVLVHDSGEHVALSRNASGGGFEVSTLPQGVRPKGPGPLDEIAGALENLTLRDVAKSGGVPFENNTRVETAFKTFDGLMIELTLQKEAHEGEHARWWASVTAYAGAGADQGVKDEAAAVTARTEGWIYRIPSWKSARLTRRNADLAEPPDAGASEVK